MVHTRMTMQMEMVELMRSARRPELHCHGAFEQMTMDHLMDDGETFTAKSGGSATGTRWR